MFSLMSADFNSEYYHVRLHKFEVVGLRHQKIHKLLKLKIFSVTKKHVIVCKCNVELYLNS